jgi:chromosome partitioning protein
MHILGVYNIKGGVGKTAAAVNLAWLAARDGYRTLVWDLDPQAAATFYFRLLPGIAGGAAPLLQGKSPLEGLIKTTNYENLDLLPSDFSYRTMDLDLDQAARPAKQLLKLLRPLSQEYDYLFLDCPPNISLVSENVFRAADALLIPTIPTILSQRTLQQLLDFIQGHDLRGVRLLPFFSMVDRRKALHLRMLEDMPQNYPQMLRSAIPYASDIERMGVHRAPVFGYARRSASAQAYEALWAEVKQRLG